MSSKSSSKWEIFEVKYQNPKFGTDDKEFLPEVHTFTVSTTGGPNDAKLALEKHHPRARLIVVLDSVAAATDHVDGSITKKALMKIEEKNNV